MKNSLFPEKLVIKNAGNKNRVPIAKVDGKKNIPIRKKIKPKINGSFEITLHEIPISIKNNNNSYEIKYFSAGNQYVETINKLDKNRLIIKNSEGIIFSYKRFEKYFNDGK